MSKNETANEMFNQLKYAKAVRRAIIVYISKSSIPCLAANRLETSHPIQTPSLASIDLTAS